MKTKPLVAAASSCPTYARKERGHIWGTDCVSSSEALNQNRYVGHPPQHGELRPGDLRRGRVGLHRWSDGKRSTHEKQAGGPQHQGTPSGWESVRPWLESTSAKVAGNRQSPQGYRGHLTLERVSPTRWARSSLCSSKSNCESFLPEGPCGGPKDSPNTNMQSNNAITLAIEMPYRAVGATTRAQISMAPTTTTA